MNQFHIDTCPKIPNWECEYVTECAAGCISKKCTYDLAQTLQPHKINNLIDANIGLDELAQKSVVDIKIVLAALKEKTND
jgi:hypothetical protein